MLIRLLAVGARGCRARPSPLALGPWKLLRPRPSVPVPTLRPASSLRGRALLFVRRINYRFPMLFFWLLLGTILSSYVVPAVWTYVQSFWTSAEELPQEKRAKAIASERRWRYGVGFRVPVLGWEINLRNPEVVERQMKLDLLAQKKAGIRTKFMEVLEETAESSNVDDEEP